MRKSHPCRHFGAKLGFGAKVNKCRENVLPIIRTVLIVAIIRVLRTNRIVAEISFVAEIPIVAKISFVAKIPFVAKYHLLRISTSVAKINNCCEFQQLIPFKCPTPFRQNKCYFFSVNQPQR